MGKTMGARRETALGILCSTCSTKHGRYMPTDQKMRPTHNTSLRISGEIGLLQGAVIDA